MRGEDAARRDSMAKLRVTAEGLNVREGPSSTAEILGALRRDTVVDLLEWS
jgi:hypothetical protein